MEEELSLKVTDRPIYGSSRLGVDAHTLELGGLTFEDPNPYLLDNPIGLVKYELTDHLGNVAAVITDELLGVNVDGGPENEYFQPNLISAALREPFGMDLTGMNWQSDVARFGFQSQLKDVELGMVHFKYRQYDPACACFLSVDPLAAKYAYNSPYAFSENRVIDSGELEGLERYYAADMTYLGQVGSSTEIRLLNAKDAQRNIQNASHDFLIAVINEANGESEFQVSSAQWLMNASMVVQFDATASDFRKSWDASNPHGPGPSKIEQNGFIVLDIDRAIVSYEAMPAAPEANRDRSFLPLPAAVDGKNTYRDASKNNLILGTFHTHPNTATENYSLRPNADDQGAASFFKAPAYTLEHGLKIDRLTPTRMSDNIGILGPTDIAKDAFNTKGSMNTKTP